MADVLAMSVAATARSQHELATANRNAWPRKDLPVRVSRTPSASVYYRKLTCQALHEGHHIVERGGNEAHSAESVPLSVMQQVMEGVSDPRWEEWKSVTSPAIAVFAARSMFSPGEQADFVAGRPGTRHIVLPEGSHDAHLDATAEWAAVLISALGQ